MKIGLAQFNPLIGNISGNCQKMLGILRQSKAEKVDLLVFPELSLTGYPPEDLLNYTGMFNEIQWAMIELALETDDDFAVLVGAPSLNEGPGKPWFNSVWFLAEGKIMNLIHKSLLPNYDVFDEDRHFESGPKRQPIFWKGSSLAVVICEDTWNIEPEKPRYHRDVLGEMREVGFDLILNITASPYHQGQHKKREEMARFHAVRFGKPFVYVNQVGAHTSLLFDGQSFVMNGLGQVVLQLQACKEELRIWNSNAVSEPPLENRYNEMEVLYQSLCLGISDFFQKNGFKDAVLGLSGGIDSALVACLAADALGPKRVHGILLPSKYSSSHSISDAEELGKNLGIQLETLPIQKSVDSVEISLGQHLLGRPADLTEENIQSRIRGVLLMALSNRHNWILLNTTNKSEAAVGYGTLYGDMCGALSVLGDLWKTEVYALSHWINRNEIRIPESILTKAPSAELRPNQKDSDSLPDYEVLDAILKKGIVEGLGANQIIELGFEKELVHQSLNLVHRSEFKRFQMAPVLRVSPRAFGSGRRMPLTFKFPDFE
ncbi:MAG: NAD+ synthase [Bacteroidetes bacterium]|nr:NAD+ synthase [Bacteroidota bacterium]